MATDISKEIDQLKNAVYGEEVRGAFISCMEKIHEENESYDNIKAQVAQSAENVEKQVGAIDTKAEEVQTSLDNLADAISIGKKQQTAIEQFVEKGKTQQTNLEETIKNAKTQQSAMIEELEENSNAQISNFDTYVAEKTQESEQAIADARQQAVQTVTKQGELSVQAVKDETAEYIEEQKNTAKEEIDSRADEKIEEINQAYKPLDEKVELLNEDVDTLKNDTKELNDKKITKFYASNQGETHITDSNNGKIQDMVLYGKSEQKQYKGINLLSPDTKFKEYVEVSISKGSFVFWATDGTPINGGNFRFFNEDKTESMWFGLDSGTTSKVLPLTINAKYVQNLVNTDFDLSKICLGIGNEPIYEPYTGGFPSPNLDYPQEIKSVVNPVVKICGKNLLKATLETQERYGVSCKNNNDGTYTFNGTLTSGENVDFYFIGDYYADKPINNNTKFFGTIGLKNKIDGISAFAIHKANVIASGYTSFTGEGLVSAFMVRIGKNVVLDNLVLKPMLVSSESEEGEFEEYKEHAVTFPYTLNAIPVNSGGNVTIDGQQYISDYVDVERGVIVRNVIKETLNTKNGFENEEYRLELHLKNNGKDNGNAKCLFSKFVFSEGETCVSGASAYLKNIKKINNDTLYTSRELKELCIEFYLIYQLKEPQETKLTTEQARVLKELTTYYQVTNIFVTSEQLNGYTTFNYPVSLENGWNYVKQQLGDNRDYIYNIDNRAQEIDMQSAEAYVNSEYAVALTELEVM